MRVVLDLLSYGRNRKGKGEKKEWDQNNISGLLQHCQAEKFGTHSVNTYKLLRQGNIYC